MTVLLAFSSVPAGLKSLYLRCRNPPTIPHPKSTIQVFFASCLPGTGMHVCPSLPFCLCTISGRQRMHYKRLTAPGDRRCAAMLPANFILTVYVCVPGYCTQSSGGRPPQVLCHQQMCIWPSARTRTRAHSAEHPTPTPKPDASLERARNRHMALAVETLLVVPIHTACMAVYMV